MDRKLLQRALPAPRLGGVQPCSVVDRHALPERVPAAQRLAEFRPKNKDLAMYRVPAAQRLANPGAYTRLLFSFGPYSASFTEEPTSPGEHFKLRIAEQSMPTEKLQTLEHTIQEKEADVRSVYVEFWDCGVELMQDVDPPALTRQIALDAVTVARSLLEIIPEHIIRDQPRIIPQHIVDVILQDALLMDNQIPLFAIRCAIQVMAGDDCTIKSARETMSRSIMEFARWHNPFDDQIEESWRPNLAGGDGTMEQSLLSCVYDAWMPSNPARAKPSKSRGDRRGNNYIPSASDLHRCGIKFCGTSTSLTKIGFDKSKRVLTLPKLSITDQTLPYFLNLLAYENTARWGTSCIIVSYVTVMDYLINDKEDIRLLEEAGAIHNLLGSHHEAAEIWNRLSMHTPERLTKSDATTMQMVRDASNSKWRKWWFSFKDTYIEKQPWLLVSIIAASVLLVLSILQTVYTLLQYYAAY